MQSKKKPTSPTTVIPEKNFSSITEIIQDPFFIDFVEKNLTQLKKERLQRLDPPDGYKYKRDYYDRMQDNDQLTPNFFIENIENVWLKKSQLNSEVRAVVQKLCDLSLQQTLLEYQTPKNTETNG